MAILSKILPLAALGLTSALAAGKPDQGSLNFQVEPLLGTVETYVARKTPPSSFRGNNVTDHSSHRLLWDFITTKQVCMAVREREELSVGGCSNIASANADMRDAAKKALNESRQNHGLKPIP